MIDKYWGNVTDKNNEKGGLIHSLNISTYAAKKGYRSKADAICPMILAYAEEWRACSAQDLIKKSHIALPYEQKWSLKGQPLKGSLQLQRLFYYSTDYSYLDLQRIFDRYSYKQASEAFKQLREYNRSLLKTLSPLDDNPVSLPKLKSDI